MIEYSDLGHDGNQELIYAVPSHNYINCHYCAHVWLIGVYRFVNDEFVVDRNWKNEDQLYIPDEEITIVAAKGLPDYVNIAGLITDYYLKSGYYSDGFYYSAFKKGRILKIAEEKYANW